MAISPYDLVTTKSSNYLVQQHRRYYSAKIPSGHPQLKQLITAPSSRHIYYADRKVIYCIDTVQKTKKNVADLPFEARCCAAGHGYFCAGGENPGYFAILKVSGDDESDDTQTRRANIRDETSILDSLDRYQGRSRPSIRVERFGGEIVNSVSIHKVPHWTDETKDDVQALITNNDRTVRIYSLTDDRQLADRLFPFRVNHASLSPSGHMMIVVGDEEEAFIFRRRDHSDARVNWDDRWELLRRLMLPTGFGERQHGFPDCLFTTAWSPDGQYCATASQDGIVYLISVSALEQELPSSELYTTLTTAARPYTPGGAIRSICFCPGPWDMLVWTENNGKVVFADLRDRIITRQTLDLNTVDDQDVVKLEDASEPEPHSDDFLRDDFDYIRQVQSDWLGNGQPHGLTDEERNILNGLRTLRHAAAHEDEPSRPFRSRVVPLASQALSHTGTQQALDRFDLLTHEHAGVPLDLESSSRNRADLTSTSSLNHLQDELHFPTPTVPSSSSNESQRRRALQILRETRLQRTQSSDLTPDLPIATSTTSHIRRARPRSSRTAELQRIHETHDQEIRQLRAQMDEHLAELDSIRDHLPRTPNLGDTDATESRQAQARSMARLEGQDSGRQTIHDERPLNSGRDQSLDTAGGNDATSRTNMQNFEDYVNEVRRDYRTQFSSMREQARRDREQDRDRGTELTRSLARTYAAERERATDRGGDRSRPQDFDRIRELALDRMRNAVREQRELERETDVTHRVQLPSTSINWSSTSLGRYSDGRLSALRYATRTNDELSAIYGPITTGLAIDQGGRIVYVGTENGIFEFTINELERKCWPALELR